MSKKLAVLGSPISHSKSPQIQLAALRELGVNATFERIEVSDLGQFLSQQPKFDALSLTMPLKEQARVYATREDDLVGKTNSANYLLRSGDQWLAFNTDVFGIRRTLAHLEASSIGILGTGATARSALVAMAGGNLHLWGRREEVARDLAKTFGAQVYSLDAALDCDLVISTLPGDALADLVGDKQRPGVLFDAVYSRPSPAGFTQYVSGLHMLIWQAIGQLRLLLNNSDMPLKDEEGLFQVMLTAAEVAE